jgi:hypothetical protein
MPPGPTSLREQRQRKVVNNSEVTGLASGQGNHLGNDELKQVDGHLSHPGLHLLAEVDVVLRERRGGNRKRVQNLKPLRSRFDKYVWLYFTGKTF